MGERLENQRPQPIVEPGPRLSLTAIWIERGQGGIRISPRETDSGTDQRQVELLGEPRRPVHVASAEGDRRAGGRHPGCFADEVVLVHRTFGLGQDAGRLGEVALGQLDVGEQDEAGRRSIRVLKLARKPKALLASLPGGVQIVPLVEDAAQAEVGIRDPGPGQIGRALDRVLVRVGRQPELVVESPAFRRSRSRQPCRRTGSPSPGSSTVPRRTPPWPLLARQGLRGRSPKPRRRTRESGFPGGEAPALASTRRLPRPADAGGTPATLEGRRSGPGGRESVRRRPACPASPPRRRASPRNFPSGRLRAAPARR